MTRLVDRFAQTVRTVEKVAKVGRVLLDLSEHDRSLRVCGVDEKDVDGVVHETDVRDDVGERLSEGPYTRFEEVKSSLDTKPGRAVFFRFAQGLDQTMYWQWRKAQLRARGDR